KVVEQVESSGLDVTAESLEKTGAQEKEEQTLIGFKSVYVFDVTQTEGKPLPELEVGKPSMDDGDAEELFRKILKASPVPVDYEEIVGSSNGYYMPRERKIVLSNALTAAQRCKTLLHELAHYLSLDPSSSCDFSRSHEELIAEGAAYIVSAHFGLDSSDYSVPYVANWAGGELKEVLSVGEKMRKVSERLIELVEPQTGHGIGQATDAA
ncbi:MAG: ImmA/IrrE family metallo-endopeptidase, partial [Deltaproteobacteria bacterium]|nr:ImmA/IrrE family metallo-endopeptidase [Deltaproteobacteria bacterium]